MKLKTNLFISSKISDLTLVQKIIFKTHRFLRRNIIKSKKDLLKDDRTPRSDYEYEAVNTCKNAVKHYDSKLSMSPNGKRYIENDREQIYIIISDNNIDIIYNTNLLPVSICKKTYNRILNIFDGEVQEKRDEKEEIIRSRIKYSIQTINMRLLGKL